MEMELGALTAAAYGEKSPEAAPQLTRPSRREGFLLDR
jgi:hypothetical protein